MSKAVVAAGILGVIGVMIGAYAAHGLLANLQQQNLTPEEIAKRLDQCDVAVRYHMMHTLAILVLGLNSSTKRSPIGLAAIILWFLGILLFSGGLYSMVFWGKMGHWAIVPSGGLCFILGWFALILVGTKLKRTTSSASHH